MFPYFGGKTRLAPTYPAPVYDTIVEPFAGGAAYAMHWLERRSDLRAIVVELDPIVAELWRWLLQPGAAERVEAIPDVKAGERTSEPLVALVNNGPTELTTIRNQGSCAVSPWHEHKWPRQRTLIAERCRKIAGRVQVIEGDYTDAPDIAATWFVDPPYQTQGKRYAQSAEAIDFDKLGEWCKNRTGQTIVTEAEPADWLPFEPHRRTLNQTFQIKTELVWYDPEHAPLRLFGGDET
tara:strand:- start:561 stop:1271 length:711 start_codon:yes stop_codon:yes gene_type:complete